MSDMTKNLATVIRCRPTERPDAMCDRNMHACGERVRCLRVRDMRVRDTGASNMRVVDAHVATAHVVATHVCDRHRDDTRRTLVTGEGIVQSGALARNIS
ncbi:hypothetical protein [Burkholderia mayonis]|uniref:Uncharacterized protein n=1 Tax=Burkholderia mayonis TaxID=1385591 RepID=A0A1B4FT13_9BURK|nr:hypothetical protein [Burkholderia mayonis]AOJ06775.1 hypothetical protein WS71_05140 [Burkholderia mayonis]KVE57705.1 hypothetical protein WS71_26680 [Burkholderia mayonis]